MSSTSFGPHNPGPQSACYPPTDSDTQQPPVVASPYEGAEALRVKNFTGQRKFQAPAADDFIKGMLAQGQLPATQASVPHPLCSVMRAMVEGIKGLWRAAKPGASGGTKS